MNSRVQDFNDSESLRRIKNQPRKKPPGKLRCFWTWPWGHIWGNNNPNSYSRICVICGTHSDALLYGGMLSHDISDNSCWFEHSLILLLKKLKRVRPFKKIVIRGEEIDL